MRVAICDDQPTLVSLIQLYVKNWAVRKEISVECYGFASAEEYLLHSDENSFDLLFLDIQMGAMSGIELAQSLRRHNERLAIVFVTGLKEYVFAGFEVQALHYLVKPVKEGDCHACLDKVLARIRETQERMLLLNLEGEVFKIALSSIQYVEALGHYLRIVTSESEFQPKMNISELENELENTGFYRCHRSYLVNFRYVTRITASDAIMDDRTHIPISRQRRDGFNQAFISYYRGRM